VYRNVLLVIILTILQTLVSLVTVALNAKDQTKLIVLAVIIIGVKPLLMVQQLIGKLFLSQTVYLAQKEMVNFWIMVK
jgi:hypothetical protein